MAVDDFRVGDPTYDDPKIFQTSASVDAKSVNTTQAFSNTVGQQQVVGLASGIQPAIKTDPDIGNEVATVGYALKTQHPGSLLTGIMDAGVKLKDDIAGTLQGVKPEAIKVAPVPDTGIEPKTSTPVVASVEGGVGPSQVGQNYQNNWQPSAAPSIMGA